MNNSYTQSIFQWHYVEDGLPEMSKKWKICSDDILFVTICDNKRHFGYFNSEKRFEEYGGLAHMFLPDMVKCFCYVPEVPEEK